MKFRIKVIGETYTPQVKFFIFWYVIHIDRDRITRPFNIELLHTCLAEKNNEIAARDVITRYKKEISAEIKKEKVTYLNY